MSQMLVVLSAPICTASEDCGLSYLLSTVSVPPGLPLSPPPRARAPTQLFSILRMHSRVTKVGQDTCWHRSVQARSTVIDCGVSMFRLGVSAPLSASLGLWSFTNLHVSRVTAGSRNEEALRETLGHEQLGQGRAGMGFCWVFLHAGN